MLETRENKDKGRDLQGQDGDPTRAGTLPCFYPLLLKMRGCFPSSFHLLMVIYSNSEHPGLQPTSESRLLPGYLSTSREHLKVQLDGYGRDHVGNL